MKVQIFKSRHTIATLILSVFLFSGLNAQEATKRVEKSFRADKGFALGIDNKYGKIDIVNWDKSEVSVVVNVKVEASSQGKAEDLLKQISIDIEEGANRADFETNIDMKNFNGKKNVEVHYMVKAPAYINADLAQKYGSVYIQSLTGDLNLEIKYGNLEAGNIVNSTKDAWNTLEFEYSDGSIQKTGNLSAELAYAELTVSESNMLTVESAYSKLYGGFAGGMELESKYDKFSFDEVVDFEGEFKYSGIKLGKLNGSFEIEGAYTNVDLGNVDAGFSSIDVDLAYGNLTGSLASGCSFTVDAEASYGSIDLPEGDYNEHRSGTSQTVSGKSGVNPKSKIVAVLKYGNIRL